VTAEICGSDPTAGIVEMAVRELGAQRVMYGSDFTGRSFASQLAKVYGADALRRLTAAGSVYSEISMLEGVGGLSNLLTSIPPERVLFGSHFPFFHLEAALGKLRESDLTSAQATAITCGNAERLLRA